MTVDRRSRGTILLALAPAGVALPGGTAAGEGGVMFRRVHQGQTFWDQRRADLGGD